MKYTDSKRRNSTTKTEPQNSKKNIDHIHSCTLPLSYTTVPDVRNDEPITEKMVAVVIPVYEIDKFLKG